MVSMFIKKVVTVPAATLLLSLGANAMSQDQCQQNLQQCDQEVNLEMPKLSKAQITCRKIKDQTVYELKGGTKIIKKQTVQHELSAVQDFVDGDGDDKTFCTPKLAAIPLGLEDAPAQKGYNCQAAETRVIRTKIDADFGGRKIGNVVVTNYSESELIYGEGDETTDALFVEGKTGCMSVEEFIDGMTQDNWENFSLVELRDLIDAQIRKLHNGHDATVKHCHQLQQQQEY